MKCIICDCEIGKNDARSSVLLFDGPHRSRHLYACRDCSVADGPFDRLIDALPTDLFGNPQDLRHLEIKSLIVATDRKKLLKRLCEAKTVLLDRYKKAFRKCRFDFRGRRLTGDGYALEWRIRPMPDKVISYSNQQTINGSVHLIKLTECEV